MPKRLAIINGLLILIAAGSVVLIARQLMTPMAMPLSGRSQPSAPPAARGEKPASDVSAYTNVAARNLFSPTRTESAPTSTTASAPAAAGKPSLSGVVLREGSPIAYLEDPSTKRVAGYRVGDTVAGGTVQTINADSVVINRADGSLDVRLRDPGKPRPAPPATAALPRAPGAQPVAGAPVLPGVIPPAGQPAGTVAPGPMMTQPPGAVQPPPGQVVQPGSPPALSGRRPLPPNLLRRLPQGSPSDAAPR